MNIITCPNCKMRVLPKADGTCPSCQAVLTPQELKPAAPPPAAKAESPATRLSGPPPNQHAEPTPEEAPVKRSASRRQEGEQILLVIHGAGMHGLADFTIGDLILTDRRIHFLQLSVTQDSGLLFGAVGAAVSALTEKKKIASLRSEVDPLRRNMYGLPLSERMALKTISGKSFSFAAAEVESLQVKKSTEIHLKPKNKKVSYIFMVPEMDTASMNALRDWPSGEALYDAARDPDGFFVGSASPRELLLQVAKGKPGADVEVYRLAANVNYRAMLFNIILQLDDASRRKVLHKFASAPEVFREALGELAGKRARSFRTTILAGVILLIVAVLLGAQAISSRSLGTALPAAICLLLGISLLVSTPRSLRIAREVENLETSEV